MKEDKDAKVDTNSLEFERGVEAGLNSPQDSKNWQAGNELGQELSDEKADNPIEEPIKRQAEIPLFLRDRTGSKKGNQQDEKDQSEE